MHLAHLEDADVSFPTDLSWSHQLSAVAANTSGARGW